MVEIGAVRRIYIRLIQLHGLQVVLHSQFVLTEVIEADGQIECELALSDSSAYRREIGLLRLPPARLLA